MAEIIRFQLRRDTSANWSLFNPVLADGEPGFERGTGRGKLGDGVTAWNDLPYNTAGWQGVLDAVAAREGALASEASAAADASLAELYRGDAQVARTGAETARSAAQTARTGAETARSGAETALSGATTARAGAEAARDAAGAFHSTTVQSGSVVNGQLVLRKNDNTTQVAGDVRGPALVATVLDTVTGPETPGATGAQGLKGDKGDPGGFTNSTILATGTNFDDLVTSGIYFNPVANVAAAPGPRSTGGHLLVIQAATWVKQIYTPMGEPRADYVRTRTSSNVWGPWRVIAAQRVDETAGRAIYTWDDVNNREQLVYGDTGSRVITDLVDATKWTVSVAKLRRVGPQVELRLGLTPLAGNTGTVNVLPAALPQGFRNQHSANFPIVDNTNAIVSASLSFAGGPLSVNGIVAGRGITALLTFQTYDTWPTTLPGTADGAVNNT